MPPTARKPPTANFYPRPPRGGRPISGQDKALGLKFLSTPSARRATRVALQYGIAAQFLSTPSARRATRCWRARKSCGRNFYPRPPRGGRRVIDGNNAVSYEISIHALREEGDGGSQQHNESYSISIHALREEGDD